MLRRFTAELYYIEKNANYRVFVHDVDAEIASEASHIAATRYQEEVMRLYGSEYEQLVRNGTLVWLSHLKTEPNAC